VSLGAPLPFVQECLGHASWDVTAKHYARWVPAAGMETARLEAGEVWPDVLAGVALSRAPTRSEKRDLATSGDPILTPPCLEARSE